MPLQQTQRTDTPEYTQYRRETQRDMRDLWRIAGVVIVLLLLGYGVYAYQQADRYRAATSPSTAYDNQATAPVNNRSGRNDTTTDTTIGTTGTTGSTTGTNNDMTTTGATNAQ